MKSRSLRKMQLALTLNKLLRRVREEEAKADQRKKERPDLWDGRPYRWTLHGPGYGMRFLNIKEIENKLKEVMRSS